MMRVQEPRPYTYYGCGRRAETTYYGRTYYGRTCTGHTYTLHVTCA
jgi:hypothetical protein